VANVTSSLQNDVIEMRASIEQLKMNIDDLKSKGGNQSASPSSPLSMPTTSQSNAKEDRIRDEKMVERESSFEKKFEKFEKDFNEKHRTMADNLKQQLESLRVDILRDVSRDFVVRTDNGTDVMKSVYSVIHSIGDGLKRTSAKQRADGGTLVRCT
jgi:predicted RNA-binding protein with RPS1 domain